MMSPVADIQTFAVRTATREEMIDITAQVRAAIKRSGVTDGLCCVYCPHTTAGVTIQENADPDVKADMVGQLARVVPKNAPFRHDEGNSDAHIKSSLIGATSTLIIDDGKPVLGTWQAVFFCEFDGPRERQVKVKVIQG
jgi:secondary thiamine-phosphate synthase enzyme